MSDHDSEDNSPHDSSTDDETHRPKTVEDWYKHGATWDELTQAAKAEVWLDDIVRANGIERDALGSSRIAVSETTTAYAYDDEEGGVTVDVDSLDRAPADASVANLSVEDARALRADLDVALRAIEREREHYEELEE